MSDRVAEQVGRRVLFSGRVQGVGFRYTTCDVAGRFQVTGQVKNLPDGRVELICEGEREETVRFVDAVYQAMSDYIGEMHSEEIPATGRFKNFAISF
jgi:acylphosphatase